MQGYNLCIVRYILFCVFIDIIHKEKICDIEHDDNTKGKTHGYPPYEDAYVRQLKYAFPVLYLRRFLEKKIVVPYMIKHDVNDKLQNMFKQMIIDADIDEECGCNHDHNQKQKNTKDKKNDSECEKLISSTSKTQCCDH